MTHINSSSGKISGWDGCMSLVFHCVHSPVRKIPCCVMTSLLPPLRERL